MDSFYDAPRMTPAPVAAERVVPTTVVPEVSLLCTDGFSQNEHKSPYATWKLKNNQFQNYNANKENVGIPFNQSGSAFRGPQNTSQMKKQVRFESPIQQQRPSLTYEPFLPKSSNNIHHTEVRESNSKGFGQMVQKPFEQIYMANVPNRHLDLSIIEQPIKPQYVGILDKQSEQILPYNEPKIVRDEVRSPKTYKEYVESQKKIEVAQRNDNCVTDIFSYINNKKTESHNRPIQNESPQTQNIEGINNKKSEYSIRPALNTNKTDQFNLPAKTVNRFNEPPIPCSTELEYSIRPALNTNKTDQFNSSAKTVNRFNEPPIPFSTEAEYNIRPVLNTNKTDQFNSPAKTVNRFNEPPIPFSTENFHNSPHRQMYINHIQPVQNNKKCDNITQTSTVFNPDNGKPTCDVIEKKDDEPSVKDLLKIISKQNEQLLLLQKQVASLIERDKTQKQIEMPPTQTQAPYVTSTQHEKYNTDISSPRKRLPKFSIDLMTSFEVSFRPQNKQKEFINYEPKIQEITETESTISETNKKCTDTSIQFEEPLKVRESCPSPDPSIKINDFEDYDSSSDESVSEIGATFYKNLMGQVNNILKKAQIQPTEDLTKFRSADNELKQRTMNKVKEATLKHLRNIGVSVPNIDDSNNCEGASSNSNDSNDYSPTDISFAVKQLLMKYLPNDHLAKITFKKTESVPVNVDEPEQRLRPELSFASLQYLKKYNLLTSNDKKAPEIKNKKLTRLQGETPKILDISALKQQPKLL